MPRLTQSERRRLQAVWAHCMRHAGSARGRSACKMPSRAPERSSPAPRRAQPPVMPEAGLVVARGRRSSLHGSAKLRKHRADSARCSGRSGSRRGERTNSCCAAVHHLSSLRRHHLQEGHLPQPAVLAGGLHLVSSGPGWVGRLGPSVPRERRTSGPPSDGMGASRSRVANS
jgi:hypothetical protein